MSQPLPQNVPGVRSLQIPEHYLGHKNPTAAYALDKEVIGYLNKNKISSPSGDQIQFARRALGKSAIRPADLADVTSRVQKTMGLGK